jgi:DNA-binding LacI/PurR family transcriptional regulator
MFCDPMVPRLLHGIGEELSSRGLQMVLFAPQTGSDLVRLDQYLAGGHVDAVLLLAPHESESLVTRLKAHGIPMVSGGRPRGSHGVSFVDIDNHSAARIATEHLIAQGRRRIAHIAGPKLHAPAGERQQGFREAMWNAALSSHLIEQGGFDRDSGEFAMHRLLARSEVIDAVFASSDAMAAGALWALQVVGLRVPEDVAVIGFDDTPMAAATQPPLTSVRQPVEQMGREMARLVLTMSSRQDHSPREVMLTAELAIRASTN